MLRCCSQQRVTGGAAPIRVALTSSARICSVMKTAQEAVHPAMKSAPAEQSDVFTLTFDPFALPLCPTKSHEMVAGSAFIRDPEIGAGEESHRDKMESLTRRAGNW